MKRGPRQRCAARARRRELRPRDVPARGAALRARRRRELRLRDVPPGRSLGRRRPGDALLRGRVARWIGHDTALFSKLVLGCIDSYDSEKWRIFSHFSRSTRFSHFRTALNAKFQQISLTFSRNFNKICKILKISQDFDKNDEFS